MAPIIAVRIFKGPNKISGLIMVIITEAIHTNTAINTIQIAIFI